jgi:hypothetical protein
VPTPTNEAECTAAFTPWIEDDFAEQNEAVAAGRLRYDGGAAAACFAELDAAVCTAANFGPQNEACDDIFVGAVAVGGMCLHDDECVGDGDAICFGQACTALPAVGMACMTGGSVGDQCVHTAYCDQSTTLCVARKANGAVCVSALECLSLACDATGHCSDRPPSTQCDGV